MSGYEKVGDGHGHGHAEEAPAEAGHDHGHGHKEEDDHGGHDHGHGHKEEDDHGGHDHGHGHKEEDDHGGDDHGHGHKEKDDHGGHDHGHGHKEEHDHGGHEHGEHCDHGGGGDHGGHDHGGHDHGHGHGHGDEEESHAAADRQKLFMALGFCASFMIVEFVAGYISNSLAIITDAAHLATDASAFGLAIAATYLAEKGPTSSHSYGYQRAEVLSSLASTLFIWVLTIILIWEALQRVVDWVNDDMEEVDGKTMSIVALIGVFVNLILERILGGNGEHGHSHGGTVHKKHVEMTNMNLEDGGNHSASYGSVEEEHDEHVNVNMDAAYLHVIGDLIQSVGVMVAGLIIWWKPTWQVIDPLCTFVFAGIVMFTTLNMLRSNINVLLEGVPDDVDIDRLRAHLLEIKDDTGASIVMNVHDLHVWNIAPGKPLLSAHIHASNAPVALQKAHYVCQKYGIPHATIQINGPNDPCSSKVCCREY